MSGTPLIEPTMQRVVGTVLYLLLAIMAAAFGAVWIWLVLNLAHLTTWPQPIGVPTALSVFAISLSILCAAVWMENRVGILRLKEATAAAIWKVCVATLLGGVSIAVGIVLQR